MTLLQKDFNAPCSIKQINTEETNTDEAENDRGKGEDRYEACYLKLQRFYCQQAGAISVSADFSAQTALQYYESHCACADEATQLKTYWAVATVVRYFRNGTLQKICLFGGQNQLAPTVRSITVNEFAPIVGNKSISWDRPAL